VWRRPEACRWSVFEILELNLALDEALGVRTPPEQ
jgi:hypothetical protein